MCEHMKVLLNKLKKCNKIQLFFYFFTLVFYIIGFVYFTINILKLKGIETGLRLIAIIFFSIWLLLYPILNIVCMILRKNKIFIITTIFNILFIIIFFVSSYVVNLVINNLNNISKEYLNYTSNLITLNDTELNGYSKIGMINNTEDIEGYILAQKIIEKENLNYEIVEYDDYFKMAFDMYQHEIDGFFISSNYSVTLKANDNFKNIDQEVKVVYSYTEKMKNQDNKITDKKLTEPFSMLIMGVDSSLDGLEDNQAFNGDTLILVTFNPKTLTATMLSIPRDMYVPIACRNNAYDKINSSAAYGSNCVIKTIENITDVEIDYFLKINFKGVVSLVDALGGVKVNVEKPDFNTFNGQVCEQDSDRKKGEHLVCMNPGLQTLNGEQALAYARCRHLYLLSDIDRNRHQQDIIVALAQSLKNISSLDEIKKILNTISNNIDSNMSSEQILSFYEVCKQMLLNANTNDESLITIKKTYLEYYSLPVYLPAYNMTTSALGYYNSSMEAIKKAMKVNLELEDAEMVKTYSIDYNENYEPGPIGKGLTDNNVLETFPDFTGKTEDYVRSWCNNRGITVSISEVHNSADAGTVVYQSIHKGTFVKNVSRVTIHVSNGLGSGSQAPGDIIIDNEE